MKVYLSGPISGLTFRQVTEWRRQVADELEEDFDYEVRDPMRDVQADPDVVIGTEVANSFTVTSVDQSLMTDRGIVTRDYCDTCQSDLLIVNLLDAHEKSIGTIAEVAWAYDHRIPTVVIMEDVGNPHEHPFVREMTSYRVDTVDRAIQVARSVLGSRPY